MALYGKASSSKQALPSGVTEFDILRSSHQFLREDDDGKNEKASETSWEDQLAKKYYDSLYREFAVCDLKHYKSGNFALRWRTEEEVIAGAGEETCGNTRCAHHHPRPLSSFERDGNDRPPSLNTVELPFAYEERGVRKEALVKVVLCGVCLRKLMYKREMRSKEMRNRSDDINGEETKRSPDEARHLVEDGVRDVHGRKRSRGAVEDDGIPNFEAKDGSRISASHKSRNRRGSRSRSPREEHHRRHKHKHL